MIAMQGQFQVLEFPKIKGPSRDPNNRALTTTATTTQTPGGSAQGSGKQDPKSIQTASVDLTVISSRSALYQPQTPFKKDPNLYQIYIYIHICNLYVSINTQVKICIYKHESTYLRPTLATTEAPTVSKLLSHPWPAL